MSTKGDSADDLEAELREAQDEMRAQLVDRIAEIGDEELQSMAPDLTRDELPALSDTLELLLTLQREYGESFVLYGESFQEDMKVATLLKPSEKEEHDEYGQDMVLRVRYGRTRARTAKEHLTVEQVVNSQPDYELDVLDFDTAWRFLSA